MCDVCVMRVLTPLRSRGLRVEVLMMMMTERCILQSFQMKEKRRRQSAAENICLVEITCGVNYELEINDKKKGPSIGLITSKLTPAAYLDFRLISAGQCKKGDVGSRCTDTKTMDILHVFVPEALRGLKIAEDLAREAFSIAESQNWDVKPSCSYICDTFLKRFPEHEYQLVLRKKRTDLDSHHIVKSS